MVLVSLACAVSFGMMEFFTNFLHYGGANKSFFDLVIDIFYDTILPLNGFAICALVIFRWKKVGLNAELRVGDSTFQDSLFEKYVNFSLTTFIPLVLLFVFVNTVLNKFFETSLIG
jgi:NSS family neurotransmitter:Na+ symporter